MNIHCLAVPNEQIKTRKGFTGADWWIDENGDMQLRVANELPEVEQHALAIHEIFEALMCKHTGVTVEQVDDFDKKYQNENEIDLFAGDHPDAPYRVEHSLATAAERIFTGHLGVDWKSYDERLGAL